MRVREIMQPQPRTVERDAPAIHALQQMLWTCIRHLPVLHEGHLVGVVSERDLLASRSDRERLYGEGGDRIGDVMSAPARTTHPNADVADVAAEMSVHRIGCMPVLDAGTVVGIVTTTDLLAAEAWLAVELGEPETRSALDIMTRHVRAAHPTDRLLDAAAVMTQQGVRHLPVVDGTSRVIGILSDRDIRQVIGELTSASLESTNSRLLSLRVADVMTPDPQTIPESAALDDVVRALLGGHVGALPVVDEDGILRGIISYVDVLHALAGAAARPRSRKPRARSRHVPPA